jgi:hypothetical protein
VIRKHAPKALVLMLAVTTAAACSSQAKPTTLNSSGSSFGATSPTTATASSSTTTASSSTTMPANFSYGGAESQTETFNNGSLVLAPPQSSDRPQESWQSVYAAQCGNGACSNSQKTRMVLARATDLSVGQTTNGTFVPSANDRLAYAIIQTGVPCSDVGSGGGSGTADVSTTTTTPTTCTDVRIIEANTGEVLFSQEGPQI